MRRREGRDGDPKLSGMYGTAGLKPMPAKERASAVPALILPFFPVQKISLSGKADKNIEIQQEQQRKQYGKHKRIRM